MITTETSIDGPFLIDRCLSGEIILVRRFLQNVGVYDLVRGTIISAAKTVNHTIARQIESEGFDKLHDLLSVDELIQLVKLTDENLYKVVRKLYKAILRNGFRYRGSIWVLKRPIVRFHTPHDRTHKHRKTMEQFRKEYGEGRLTVLRPHRDGWFKQPSTCVNVWISLGTIVPGNGISIFPEDFTNPLEYEEFQGVTRSQPLTRPVNLTMSEGDALFFHANQLHSSELNHSDLTRTVLSLRFVLDDPHLTTSPPRFYCFLDSKLPISLCWLLDSEKLHLNEAIRQWLQGMFRRLSVPTPNSGSLPRKQCPEDIYNKDPKGFRLHEPDSISVDMLAIGQPVAISEQHLIVKLDQEGEQQVWRLDRRCPHEGADLALGYVDNQYIRCPWHNLPIDIRTGRSACKSLDSIGTRQCAVRGGHIVLS